MITHPLGRFFLSVLSETTTKKAHLESFLSRSSIIEASLDFLEASLGFSALPVVEKLRFEVREKGRR